MSGQLHEHFLYVFNAVTLSTRPLGIGHAPSEPGGYEREARLIERFRRSSELGDDLSAISAVDEHLLYTTDLTLSASQTLE